MTQGVPTGDADTHFGEFLSRFEHAWNSGDFSKVRRLWAEDVEEPWHFPEETEDPVIGWPALDA